MRGKSNLSNRKKILFLAHLFPLPLDSGGKIKSYYTLKNLAAKHDVYTLAYVRSHDEIEHLNELKSVCGNIEIVHLRRGKLRQLSDLAKSLITGKSFIVSRDYRDDMQAAYDRLIKSFNPDVVHIDHLQMAQFVDFKADYKTVLDHHNVESMIIERIVQSSESAPEKAYARIEWPKLREYELEICRKSDLVLTVSEEDKSTLKSLCTEISNIESVPIGVDIDHFQRVERDEDTLNILSIATMYWPPNVDSMLYFCRDIFPLVKSAIPESTVTVAGQRPVDSIRALAADPSIKVVGYVSDSREMARDCGVFIVPLRSGSGVRVKILNALAMGLPVVSTSIGAEGLDVESGKHLILADTPSDFADAVILLLRDKKLADQIGRNGRDLVCEKYSWEIVGDRLHKIYYKLGGAS